MRHSTTCFNRLVAPNPPANSIWCRSLGGKEDHLFDIDSERHADVFPDVESLITAGSTGQTESDHLFMLGESPPVGIPHLLKRQGKETFGRPQRARDAKLAAKNSKVKQELTLAH